ncbi:MAG: hypothetical protein AAGI30_09650 [Planctomycetota bacterium]
MGLFRRIGSVLTGSGKSPANASVAARRVDTAASAASSEPLASLITETKPSAVIPNGGNGRSHTSVGVTGVSSVHGGTAMHAGSAGVSSNGGAHSSTGVLDPAVNETSETHDVDLDDSGEWISATPNGTPTNGTGNGGTGNGQSPERMSSRPLARVAPIRSKQELFEELQKNYHEVVELVRKVDHHLDREQRRSARVMEVLDRVDGLIPTLERLPTELNTKAEQLNGELIAAIREQAGAGSPEIVAAVEKVGDQLRTGSKAQDELSHTMASFRQTIGDLAASTERSNEMIRSIETTNAKRENELAGLIASGRRAQTIALGAAVTIGVVAMGVAVLAIVS